MGWLICIEELACIFRCAGDLTVRTLLLCPSQRTRRTRGTPTRRTLPPWLLSHPSSRSSQQGNPSLEELGALLTCMADLSYCSICACYQTQHKVRKRLPRDPCSLSVSSSGVPRFPQARVSSLLALDLRLSLAPSPFRSLFLLPPRPAPPPSRHRPLSCNSTPEMRAATPRRRSSRLRWRR